MLAHFPHFQHEKGVVIDLQQQLEAVRRRCEAAERESLDTGARARDAENRVHQSETRIAQLERDLRLESEDYAQLRARTDVLDRERADLEVTVRCLFLIAHGHPITFPPQSACGHLLTGFASDVRLDDEGKGWVD
ncbi:unnamed protein product [Protopolystoma xenopodis]|uniref:Uncharacterized protein n=1 Tax=Protopolystoma xenopodis TaxID=117903 RepID=A0A3S5CIQ3_9PLAT|nr:unnamed protein product [Protopolystoma xenopodis]